MKNILIGFIFFITLQNIAFADFTKELLDSSGQKAYQEELKKVEQKNNIGFDSPLLKEYYYALIKSGYSQSLAWKLTMLKQEELRAEKDRKSNTQQINQNLYIYEQENYVNSLYQQMQGATNPELKIRLNNMMQLAYQITEQNRALYKKDPVLYFIQKDPYMPHASVNNPQYYKERFERLDYHYDKLDIVYKLRNYLTNEEKEELAKEIKFYKNLKFKEKEVSFIDMNYRYGNYYGKDYLSLIIKNLLYEDLISNKDIEFIETIKKKEVIVKKSKEFAHKIIELKYYLIATILILVLALVFFLKKYRHKIK